MNKAERARLLRERLKAVRGYVLPALKPERKRHQTLRVTPAMEAGVSDHVWSIEEICRMADWEFRKAA